MNDLLSDSFSLPRDQDRSPPPDSHTIEMTGTTNSGNLDSFFNEVEAVKDELCSLETIHGRLVSSHDRSNTLHTSAAVRDLRSAMDADVTTALRKTKLIKSRLESLDRANAASRLLPGCGPGSSTDRTRTSVVDGLRQKLKSSMSRFNELREKIGAEYRETVRRRYFAVNGEEPDVETVERLVETGEGEMVVARAVQRQGRGEVEAAVAEIRERHEAAAELERNLRELHGVFLDMAVLVEAQGEQMDDIERQVNRASSYVRGGARQLEVARKHQKSSRKWACVGILMLLIIVLIVVLSLRPWR
ncbi:Syntaxin-121 [Striga hermonthica]|uniref:Syntaxin-121 n=1 Tax=Striga hermonthica TaxID=68872 RepID=A0A9N7R7N3_STRHE|nr:Syntaxin-121 [Striga hermonthica]